MVRHLGGDHVQLLSGGHKEIVERGTGDGKQLPTEVGGASVGGGNGEGGKG